MQRRHTRNLESTQCQGGLANQALDRLDRRPLWASRRYAVTRVVFNQLGHSYVVCNISLADVDHQLLESSMGTVWTSASAVTFQRLHVMHGDAPPFRAVLAQPPHQYLDMMNEIKREMTAPPVRASHIQSQVPM